MTTPLGDARTGPGRDMSPARSRVELAPRLRVALAPRPGRRAALMPYLTGGYPDLETCGALLATCVEAGADVLEIGVPFSDPVADGPVVQASSHAALELGTTTDDVLRLAATVADRLPIVLLAYANTALAGGADRFARRAVAAGVEGVVVPDLPVDEAGEAAGLMAAAGLSLVPMATPTATDRRLDMVAEAASSFIYCVAVTGVTGARSQVGDELAGLIDRLRRRTDVPLVVGFGISTPQQAVQVAELADGVIIGSALIARIAAAVESPGTASSAPAARGVEATTMRAREAAEELVAAAHMALTTEAPWGGAEAPQGAAPRSGGAAGSGAEARGAAPEGSEERT